MTKVKTKCDLQQFCTHLLPQPLNSYFTWSEIDFKCGTYLFLRH